MIDNNKEWGIFDIYVRYTDSYKKDSKSDPIDRVLRCMSELDEFKEKKDSELLEILIDIVGRYRNMDKTSK